MKMKISFRHEAALTRLDVLVLIALFLIVGFLLLGSFAQPEPGRKVQHINCVNNLKQVGLAYRIWEGDNNDNYPMGVSVTNGGAMEMVQAGNAVISYLVMSNELSTPKILYCPKDRTRITATRFGDLSNSNLSYFAGAEVKKDDDPKLILSGDCNFEMDRKPVGPGLVSFGTNEPIAWQTNRHGKSGNLGFAVGSVQSATQAGLRAYVVETGVATNRWAIP
jgi:hypothetical protein